MSFNKIYITIELKTNKQDTVKYSRKKIDNMIIYYFREKNTKFYRRADFQIVDLIQIENSTNYWILIKFEKYIKVSYFTIYIVL